MQTLVRDPLAFLERYYDIFLFMLIIQIEKDAEIQMMLNQGMP